MIYFLEISPQPIQKILLKESHNIMQKIYNIDFDGIYYRVKTSTELQDPRRMFVKGNGQILEGKVQPQINLVHNISIPDEQVSNFKNMLDKTIKQFPSYTLRPIKIDDYGSSFTLFIEYEKNQTHSDLKRSLVELSKPYIHPIEYKQYFATPIIPHLTIIYDDIAPRKINKAKQLLDTKKLLVDVQVSHVLLWEFTLQKQKVNKMFPLIRS